MKKHFINTTLTTISLIVVTLMLPLLFFEEIFKELHCICKIINDKISDKLIDITQKYYQR